MIRGDNIICGTTTTGTGTLTLAATPVPPGGVDFDVFARATGIGFGNSAAILVSYTIIEYTTSSFATAKAHEKGIGTLTLGGSSGIANATLARTTLHTTATSLNAQPAAQNVAPGTGISIGTAANTLVFVGASAAETIAFDPYICATGTSNGGGYVGPLAVYNNATGACNAIQVSGTDYYYPFMWIVPMLVKRFSIETNTSTTGTTNLWARIYAVSTLGQPGKLLIDFGVIGTGGSSLNSSPTPIVSALHGTGFFLTPGAYFLNLIAQFSTGSPVLYGIQATFITASIFGNDQPANIAHGQQGMNYATAASGTQGAAPDPANLTSFSIGFDARPPGFTLRAT